MTTPAVSGRRDDSEAAERLAAVLRHEGADLLTCYDDNGTYGHPDHIKVHRVAVKAAELAGVDVVYEATLDRDHFRSSMDQLMSMAAEAGLESIPEQDQAEFEAELDEGTFGVEGARITHHIDVRPALAAKRAALRAHASQIPPDSFFVALPDEAFELVFGTEWFICRDAAAGGASSIDLFAALDGD